MESFSLVNVPARVAVGSTNPAKVAAVRAIAGRVAPEAEIVALGVPSGVAEQPIGEAETLAGAIARARAVQTATGAAWGIGLEGGVIFAADGAAWLCNYAAVVTDAGTVQWGEGARLLLPPSVAARLRAGEELGPIMDDITGVRESKTKGGAIGYLTGGLVSRTEMWAAALACALAPLIHPALYAPADRTQEAL